MYREISIKRMVWYVIKKWRLILCVMILCAAFFGIRQYRMDTANAIASQNVVMPTIYEVRDGLTDAQMAQIEVVHKYELQKEALEDYIVESIYMQIPYESVAVVRLQYDVTGKDGIVDTTEYIQAYRDYVESGELGEDIVNDYKLDITGQYITELIVSENNASLEIDDEFAGLVIEIKHLSIDEATKLSQMVQTKMQEFGGEVSSRMGENQLILQSETIGKKMDYNLFAYQRNIIGDYEGATEEYVEALNSLNANQRTVYENWDVLMNSTEESVAENTDVSAESETIAEPQPIQVSINKTQIILGALIGLFVSVICLMVYYIGTKKVRGSSDFANLSIETLGEIESDKKKKVLGVVDQLLNNIQYSNEKNFTHEKRMEMLAASVSLKCKQNDTDEVYLTGASLGEAQKQMLVGLTELLEKKGIHAVIGENIARNADSLIKASEVKNVVLVEAEQGSFFEDMAEEVRVCKNHELKVLGGILVRA